MLKNIQNIHPIYFLLIATILEVSGDAIIRKSIYNNTGMLRMGLMLLGALSYLAMDFF